MFTHLLDEPAEYALTEHAVFIRWGDEIRAHFHVPSEFPDCRTILPEEHEGPEMVVNREAFLTVAKQAVSESPWKYVTLSFESTALAVRSYQENDTSGFEARIPAKANGEGAVFLDGKKLLDALKAADTPCVRVCYALPTDPVLIESGFFRECLWPMR